MPSYEAILRAHEVYQQRSTDELIYKAASKLVDLTLDSSPYTLAASVGFLLTVWNQAFYRFSVKFDDEHLKQLQALLDRHKAALRGLRNRSIFSFCEADMQTVEEVFRDFELLLGPVGAAKALHLVAPQFFAVWDRFIATAYGFSLKKKGENAKQYIDFLCSQRRICQQTLENTALAGDALKCLDEFNFAAYTRHWVDAEDTSV